MASLEQVVDVVVGIHVRDVEILHRIAQVGFSCCQGPIGASEIAHRPSTTAAREIHRAWVVPTATDHGAPDVLTQGGAGILDFPG